MVADSEPTEHVIAYGLAATEDVATAADEQDAAPTTPDVARVSPFLSPETVAVNKGFASPYARDFGSAVTVR